MLRPCYALQAESDCQPLAIPYEIAKRFMLPELMVCHFFDGGWCSRSWDGNRAV